MQQVRRWRNAAVALPFIVDAEATTEVQILQVEASGAYLFHVFSHDSGRILEDLYVFDRRTNMTMDSQELNVLFTFLNALQIFYDFWILDAKFGIGKASANIPMDFGINIRIDSQQSSCSLSCILSRSYYVLQIEFWIHIHEYMISNS